MKKGIKAGIIDYSLGNVSSVRSAIEKLGFHCVITNDTQVLESCTHLILPGVGAFREACHHLNALGLDDYLQIAVIEKKRPILGICLGMQLMLETGTENGRQRGLGWVGGTVERIEVGTHDKLPHVGWNEITICEGNLYADIENQTDFYFDHSYCCQIDKQFISATVNYSTKFAASLRKGNIHGVQFHPEKSQLNGLRVLRNFLTQG
jgi:glutamine amidotransferase